MKVAQFVLQHSDMLGQWETSQTVLTLPSASIRRTRANFSGSGALTFSHGGFGVSDPRRFGIASIVIVAVIIGPYDLTSLLNDAYAIPRVARSKHASFRVHS
jgi:hypothetical protein